MKFDIQTFSESTDTFETPKSASVKVNVSTDSDGNIIINDESTTAGAKSITFTNIKADLEPVDMGWNSSTSEAGLIYTFISNLLNGRYNYLSEKKTYTVGIEEA